MAKLPPHIVWPGFVVGLLGMSVTMVTITVIAAVGDPSFAVEADYHERAMQWDEHVAQQARNEALGWGVTVSTGTEPESGRPTLIVRMHDRHGEPIDGAGLTGSCFHFARADHVQELMFVAQDELGVYAAQAMLNKAGSWDLQLRAEADGEVFTHRRTLRVGKAGD